MRIGICSANSGPFTTREALSGLADAAEEAALESIWVSEHVVVQDPQEPPSGMAPHDPILDPLAALCFLAGRTESVLLGTGVLVLPLRHPLLVAKEVATVDVLSGGRAVLGVGAGYLPREFESLGLAFGERGKRTDEAIAAIKAVWTEEAPRYVGQSFSFAHVQSYPRPLQRPHPPVVVGGHSAAALDRAVRSGDGWYGWGLDGTDARRMIEALGRAHDRIERDPALGPLEITITPPNEPNFDAVARYAELGVHRVNVMLPWDLGPEGLEALFTRLGDLARRVKESAPS